MDELTPKQKLFVQHYMECHNASEAARRAGYSERTAGAIGWENLKKPEIQIAIQEATREIMPAAEVVQRLADQARGSLGAFLRRSPNGEVWGLDLSEEQPLHLIRKLKIKKETKGDVAVQTIDIEIYDAHAALVDLGKMHGLFVDRQEISGPNGGPVPVSVNATELAEAREKARQFEQEMSKE